jgi:parallel beta-helix repeat protein
MNDHASIPTTLRALSALIFLALFVGAGCLFANLASPAAAAGSLIYVDRDATGANNGSSWTNAFTSLQSALAAAASSDSIWVAEGTYLPVTDTTQTTSFAMKPGVAIYGGFAATETLLTQRDWRLHQTVLSGELGAAGSFDNSFHVVTAGGGVTYSARLDGFTITAGDASLPDAIWGFGGGMRVYDASPALANLTFSGNSAFGGGGGLSVQRSSSSAAPRIINVRFRANSSAGFGGGLWMGPNTAPLIQNALFHGNAASYDGGAAYSTDSTASLSNITAYGNSAGRYGGGLYANGSGRCPTIAGSILWGNAAPTGRQIYNDGCSTLVLTYSTIQGGFTGAGNTSSDPLFVDPDGADNILGTSDDDLRLQFLSPATDAGANASVLPDYADLDGDGNTSEATPLDLDGNPRFYNDPFVLDTGTGAPPIVDRGAYERQRSCFVRLNDSLADYTSVQAAVDASASSGDVVKVAGACGGVSQRAGITQTVFLTKTLTIRGGYTSNNWATPDPVANPSIVSAGGLGRVFVISGTISPALDGLRITGGDAKGLHGGSPAGEDVGGGIAIGQATATITNSHIYGNAADDGAGISLGQSDSTFVGNTIYSNTAGARNGGSGGGFSVYGSTPVLMNNLIISNSATYSETTDRGGDGGGIQFFRSTPVVQNNTVRGNFAGWGGGMSLVECAGGIISGNHFVTNTADWGGGLGISQLDDGAITNNEISGNTAGVDAGGLTMEDSVITVTGNTLNNNTATGGSAGGMRIDQSAGSIISGNVVMSNTANFSGAGVFVNGDPLLVNNVIMYNHGQDGAGVHIADGSPVLWSNNVSRNHANWQGGGIKVDGGAPWISNTLIIGNQATWEGAGVLVHGATATFVNPVLVENDLTDGTLGAGIWITSGQVTLLHPTIVNNHRTAGPSHGIYLRGPQTVVTVTNAIIAVQLVGLYGESGATSTIDGVLWYANGDDTGGTGAVVTHPYTGNPKFAVDGYHLTVGSAAIDRGVPSIVATDIDGQSRLAGAAPDLGADELEGFRVYLPLVVRSY